MANDRSIMWFRQDLRLDDNPALSAAIQQGQILPLYILDDDPDWNLGGASRWWLHESLKSLNESLNNNLWILEGDAREILPRFAAEQNVAHIFWNRCYEPHRINSDRALKEQLTAKGIKVQSYNGSLMWEPWENLKQDGSPYKVFTPFYKNAIAERLTLAAPKDQLENLETVACPLDATRIEDLRLLPKNNWYKKFSSTWIPGEAGAHKRLEEFLEAGLSNYREGRDFPAHQSVSRLSPHLHFGEISPRRAAQAVRHFGSIDTSEEQAEHFIRELAWREFSYYSLYYFPNLTRSNIKSQFDRFPWRRDAESVRLWQQGQTGFPLIDAGMRELWQTGYMHNRVRMIVASFLIKNLMIHWQEGASWFWDCLVDADLANNSCSWQWVAGSGADAAPYFRIFNPVTQSQKFDPQGEYIREFLPELSKLSNKAIHDPGSASSAELHEAGVILGENYPHRMVDLKESRARALDAYKSLGAG